MFYGAGHLIFERAKKLRNNVTPTEMILWGRLKEYFFVGTCDTIRYPDLNTVFFV